MNTLLTREQKRESLSLARAECGGCDDWGAIMSHMFAVADTLYHMGADIPYGWNYRHGDLCEGQLEHFQHRDDEDSDCQYPDVEYVPYLDAGETGIAMLTYAGNVLDRYARVLDRAGMSY